MKRRLAIVAEPEAALQRPSRGLLPELSDDEALALGRVLGEALVAEFRAEYGPMVKTATGFYQREDEDAAAR